MQGNKKVKIYVDVYNGEKYLRQCIESVLNQTYTNFEFYIVDNGSKDNSPLIIQEYVDKDNRIIATLSTENIQARWMDWINDWIDDCYLTIIDHDDWWDDNYLEKLIGFLEVEDLDLSYGFAINYYNDSKKFVKRGFEMQSQLLLKEGEIPKNYFNLWISFSTIWGCIMKVGILKNIKSNLKELRENNYCLGADTVIILEYIKYCSRIGILNEYLYFYRQHDASMTSVKNYNPARFRSIVMFITAFENYAKENKINITFNDMFVYHLSEIVVKIEDSTLGIDEKIDLYNEILTHEVTIKYLKLSSVKPCDNYIKFKLFLIQIIKLYNVENSYLIKDILEIVSPKCCNSFNEETFKLFQKDIKLLQALIHDDSNKLAVMLLQLLKNDSLKYLLLSVIKSLIDEENLIITIENPDFLFRYKKISDLLINSKLEMVFDIMTDVIMSNKKVEYTDIYLNLYINVSNNLGIELGYLVGNLKLAEFLYSDNRLDESITIAKELLNLGFRSDELDTLVLNLINGN